MLAININCERKPAVILNAVNGIKKRADQSKCLQTKDSTGTYFFKCRAPSFVHT